MLYNIKLLISLNKGPNFMKQVGTSGCTIMAEFCTVASNVPYPGETTQQLTHFIIHQAMMVA